eukprot:508298-Pyramimonas_sp.AAC.1
MVTDAGQDVDGTLDDCVIDVPQDTASTPEVDHRQPCRLHQRSPATTFQPRPTGDVDSLARSRGVRRANPGAGGAGERRQPA